MLERALWERTCRTNLTAFCTEALAPFEQKPARHHRSLIRQLEHIASGKIDRLMVLMPPGSAKSTYASVLFPAWFLAQRPNRAVIGASHTADLAEFFSKRLIGTIRDHASTLDYHLLSESVGGWRTSNGGEYKAAGVGGPITGRRADLVIIDDPTKSRAVAESEVEREKAGNWYSADLFTRLKPGAAIVLIMTRWHEDDLGGRLLQTQPDRWHVLKLPAIAGDDDPLGRPRGEFLWSDDAYGYGADLRSKLADYEHGGGMRDWQALYQQDPRPGEGALFKIAQIGALEAEPNGCIWVRAWDLAATAQTGTRDPDWTVGVKLGRTKEGRFVVGDLVRLRGGPDEVDAAIVATAERDGYAVRVNLPQDPGQGGKSKVLYLTRQLAGFRVESSPESGQKTERAMPVASQANVGNLSLVRAPWNRVFLDELAAFPSGAHDDAVDALSRAFMAIGAKPPPMRISDEALALSRIARR